MEIEAANVDNVAAKPMSQSSNNSDDDEENKNAPKNPPKKIKLNKKKAKQDEAEGNNEEVIEIMDTTLKDDQKQGEGELKKQVKQSSKKQKSSDVSETGEGVKVKKKKKKNSKQVSMLGVGENVAATTPSNNTNIAKKISINSVLRLSHKKKSLLPQYTKNINLAKTPSNERRLSSIKYLQSTIKKSIIRPVQTRARAAAQVTTKPLATNTTATTSGTQLKPSTSNSNVNLVKNQPNENNANTKSTVSNVKSLANKFNLISTPSQKNPRISNLQKTASKLMKVKFFISNSLNTRNTSFFCLKPKQNIKQDMTFQQLLLFLLKKPPNIY